MVSARALGFIKDKAVFLLGALLIFIGFSGIASAQCPICVIGAAAGIEVARFFGVDDLITGVWVGALIFAFTLWMDSIIKTRQKWKRWRVPIAIAIVVLSYVSLYVAGFYSGTMISGINRLLLGDVLGSIVLILSVFVVNEELKKRNVKFPFRGVILVLGALTILSILIWVLILR
jgi:hypothetical protein